MAGNLAASSVRLKLTLSDQRWIVAQAREVCEASPLVRPRTPGGQPMRVRVTAAGRFGWVGDGAYRYDTRDANGKPWPPIPAGWTDIADTIAGLHAWDSAIVNWYEPGAALGWHRDRAERDTSLPIVTISLGDACSWAMRRDEDSPAHRCRLESGDVTLLADNTRSYLHSVERIIPAPLLSPLDGPGRISITLRVAG